ncbi:hypothetical protein TW95_gp1550 [Pandoravirus inopinatum]|uniref:Transmembrane protein n=1 Tax=Pandoravirus inopinatum TaxID=1605721 RepID=A0A0B5J3V9_9VIRU|nr:hypothetical protein TW95_gp1550 [Pandoravirus inopinatum]AJF98284.1 hypothetical protein [Pandoravirus inopinatum]
MSLGLGAIAIVGRVDTVIVAVYSLRCKRVVCAVADSIKRAVRVLVGPARGRRPVTMPVDGPQRQQGAATEADDKGTPDAGLARRHTTEGVTEKLRRRRDDRRNHIHIARPRRRRAFVLSGWFFLFFGGTGFFSSSLLVPLFWRFVSLSLPKKREAFQFAGVVAAQAQSGALCFSSFFFKKKVTDAVGASTPIRGLCLAFFFVFFIFYYALCAADGSALAVHAETTQQPVRPFVWSPM